MFTLGIPNATVTAAVIRKVVNLMAGIIKLHVYMTPPSPAQEIDFVLEYDASYVTSALQG